MDARALELRDRFFALLDQSDSAPELWRDVWRLFVENLWYQEELHDSAVRITRRAQAPPDLRGDIEQEAMLLLAKHLQKGLSARQSRMGRAAFHGLAGQDYQARLPAGTAHVAPRSLAAQYPAPRRADRRRQSSAAG
jgi:hypothetical protein